MISVKEAEIVVDQYGGIYRRDLKICLHQISLIQSGDIEDCPKSRNVVTFKIDAIYRYLLGIHKEIYPKLARGSTINIVKDVQTIMYMHAVRVVWVCFRPNTTFHAPERWQELRVFSETHKHATNYGTIRDLIVTSYPPSHLEGCVLEEDPDSLEGMILEFLRSKSAACKAHDVMDAIAPNCENLTWSKFHAKITEMCRRRIPVIESPAAGLYRIKS